MKIIHQNGYSRDELDRYKHIVYKNLVESAQDIVKAMTQLELDPVEPTNRVCFLPTKVSS
jgi:guanine nucleotide-binding protein subunit alpha